jgi:hypothetical protein
MTAPIIADSTAEEPNRGSEIVGSTMETRIHG